MKETSQIYEPKRSRQHLTLTSTSTAASARVSFLHGFFSCQARWKLRGIKKNFFLQFILRETWRNGWNELTSHFSLSKVQEQTHTHKHTPFYAQWCLNLPQYASLESWLWWKLVQDHLREIFCVWKQWQRARWETAQTEPESIPGAGSHDSHEAGLWRFSQSSVSRPHVWHVRPVSAACLFWLALVCLS